MIFLLNELNQFGDVSERSDNRLKVPPVREAFNNGDSSNVTERRNNLQNNKLFQDF